MRMPRKMLNKSQKGLSANVAGNTAGHATDDCFLWDQDKCTHCGKSNHLSADCYYKDKPKEQNKKDKAKENPRKHSRTEEANTAESDQSYAAIKEVAEVSSGGITFDPLEHGQYFNFSNENVANYSVNDESTLYYDWLANSATTSHITNRHDTFITYEPIQCKGRARGPPRKLLFLQPPSSRDTAWA
jgi:hypothetical protein